MEPENTKGNQPQVSDIINMAGQIGEEERHFNNLQKEYRLLSSKWLLAALGAIGYLLQADHNVLFNNWLLVGFIGFVGNIGIFLLWVMDIRVYHRLLNAAFLQGIEMEESHSWLPKVRTNMILGYNKGDVVDNTGLYYICSCLLLLLIATLAIAYYMYSSNNMAGLTVFSIAGLGFCAMQARYMHKKGANKLAEEKYTSLYNKYVSKNV